MPSCSSTDSAAAEACPIFFGGNGEPLKVHWGYPDPSNAEGGDEGEEHTGAEAQPGEDVEDVTVVMLDRPRHEGLAQEIRDAGARIKFISDGDVAGAIMAARPNTGVDLLLGIGGTPEGIITACAMKAMGGGIQGRLWPKDDDERQKAIDAGHDIDAVLSTDDLVKGDNCFFVATGITDGELLQGVRYHHGGAHTQSLVMRSKSGTIRVIDAEHRPSKLDDYR